MAGRSFNLDGTVNTWAEYKRKQAELKKKQEEEEAKKKEAEEAASKKAASGVQQVRQSAKPVQPQQPVQNVDDNIEDEAVKLVKISARINEKVDEVMRDMAQQFAVPFSEVIRLAIDGHLERYLGKVRYIDSKQGKHIQRTVAIIQYQ